MNKEQLYEMISELLDEAQWGGFTGGAAPLDEPPLDSGPMSSEQQQKVFDILVDTGSDPEELKASGDYPDVIEENIMNLKNIIKEELQNYLNEASDLGWFEQDYADEIEEHGDIVNIYSPVGDTSQMVIEFEDGYEITESDPNEPSIYMDKTNPNYLEEIPQTPAVTGRKAAEDRIAAMKAGKPDKRDSALMKKIKQWEEEGKKIPKHLTVGRMSDD